MSHPCAKDAQGWGTRHVWEVQSGSRLVDSWRQHEGLAGAQLFADEGEAEDAALEAVGEAGEERGFLFVLEQVELADDEVALFAGLDELGKAGMRMARTAAMAAVHGAGKHAGDKEGVVADVFADGAFGVKGRRGAVDGIGGLDHFTEVLNGMAGLVADFVEIVSLGKFTEQMGDVGGDVGVVETELAFVAVTHDLLEEGFERMSLGLHRDLP